MSGPKGSKQLLVVATAIIVPAFFVAACAIQLRGDGGGVAVGSSLTQATDPAAAELERCRTVSSEQAAELQECRRVWAENRRRFLGQRKTPAAPFINAQPNAPPPSSAPHKDPGRVLGARPPLATPKSE